MPSSDVPLISPMARKPSIPSGSRLNRLLDLLHHRRTVHHIGVMSDYKSDFLNVLASRGFIHQVSEPAVLDELARTNRITAYIGFDCTAPSLHVGNLLQIMLLYWL